MTETIRRSTRQRAALSEALSTIGEFVTAQELHARLAADGTKVGLATVYRNLQAMVADGDLDVLRVEDAEARYRACSRGHHHHLVCRVCGRTVEVEAEAVESWAAKVSAAHGFIEVSHTMELIGTCADCL